MKTTARFTKLLTFSKPEPNQKHAPFLILENMENIKKYNVPKLRFPGFGGEWGFRKLENVIELISGQHLNADEYNSINTGIPYFTGPTDFTNNKNDLKKWTTKLKKAALKDDILITVKGSGVGTLMFLELHKVAIGRQIMALRSSVNSTLFIYQFLGTKKKYYKSLASGNMIPGITRKDVLGTKLHLPTLPEQKKIAAFLTAVDTKLSQLARKKALLEKYKKGVMQKLFSREIRFLSEEGEAFPEWEKKRLGEVFLFKKTNSFSRNLLNYEKGKLKNIHYGDIHTKFKTNFIIENEYVPYVNMAVDLSKISKEDFCKIGDIVMADASEDYMDIGKAIEIRSLGNENLISGLHTHLLRYKNKCAIGFFGYLFQYRKIRLQIMKMATGVSVLGISKTNLSKIIMKIPCIEEQKRIATFLTALDEKINKVGEQAEQMREWKKGLLQQMFV